MKTVNYFLMLGLFGVTMHAMDDEPSIGAANQLLQLMEQNDGEYNWIWDGQQVRSLLKTCDKQSKGRLLYYAMAKDQQQPYQVWVWNIVAHLCGDPEKLLAHLKTFFTDSHYPNFKLSDTAAQALLSSLVRDNVTDTIAMSCLEYLLKQDIDINVTDELGRTPLSQYVEFDRVTLAEYAITLGANPQHVVQDRYCQPRYAQTPILHYACSTPMLAVLLSRGADKNARDIRGNTLLHTFAHRARTIHIPGFLIQEGADINAQNNKGNTPLHYAVKHRNQKVIDLLIECGAKSDIKNNAGQKPFEINLVHDGGVVDTDKWHQE